MHQLSKAHARKGSVSLSCERYSVMTISSQVVHFQSLSSDLRPASVYKGASFSSLNDFEAAHRACAVKDGCQLKRLVPTRVNEIPGHARATFCCDHVEPTGMPSAPQSSNRLFADDHLFVYRACVLESLESVSNDHAFDQQFADLRT